MKIMVAGCAGRMGREVLRAVLEHSEHQLVSGYVAAGNALTGRDAGELAGLASAGIAVTSNLDAALEDAEVIIDFTTPDFTLILAAEAVKRKIVLVTGTTGFTEEQQEQLAAQGRKATIVQSFNMSLGVNLLAALVEKAARVLNHKFDIEILELHHRHKADAPSGTALLLGEAAAEGRNVELRDVSTFTRKGVIGERGEGEIGFAVMRGGEVVGDHTVIFAGDHERLELSHKASDRGIYANGALTAAAWLKDKPAGLYSMRDVLAID